MEERAATCGLLGYPLLGYSLLAACCLIQGIQVVPKMQKSSCPSPRGNTQSLGNFSRVGPPLNRLRRHSGTLALFGQGIQLLLSVGIEALVSSLLSSHPLPWAYPWGVLGRVITDVTTNCTVCADLRPFVTCMRKHHYYIWSLPAHLSPFASSFFPCTILTSPSFLSHLFSWDSSSQPTQLWSPTTKQTLDTDLSPPHSHRSLESACTRIVQITSFYTIVFPLWKR